MKQKRQNSPNQSIQDLFYTAMIKANRDCTFATNKIDKTNGWSRHLDFYHSGGEYFLEEEIAASNNKLKPIALFNVHPQAPRKWNYCLKAPLNSIEEVNLQIELYEGVEDPLEEQRLANNAHYKRLWYFILQNNLVAKHARFGNCGVRAGIVFSYLWQHATPSITNIKYLSMSYDHAVVMVNDKWIIDPWYKKGIIYPVSQFEKKALEVKNYCVAQLQGLRKLKIQHLEESSWENNDKISYRVRYEVSPKELPYPKYAYGMSLEDHFSLKNIYPADIINFLAEIEKEHKADFKPILNEFNFFWKKQ